MSWFVLLTPLLVLPVLGLLRLVGCSLAFDPPSRPPTPTPQEAEDQDDPDSPPPDPPPSPDDARRRVHLAPERSDLLCPLDDDEPYSAVPIQLLFVDPGDGDAYEVRVTLDRQDDGGDLSSPVTLESRRSGRPDRTLVCFACIRQRTPYRVAVRVSRLDDGDSSELVRGECTAPGLSEEGALVRFVWNEEGDLESTLCLEAE